MKVSTLKHGGRQASVGGSAGVLEMKSTFSCGRIDISIMSNSCVLQGTSIVVGWFGGHARDGCTPITRQPNHGRRRGTYCTESGSASKSACCRGGTVAFARLPMA
jgi:hypothetical protein